MAHTQDNRHIAITTPLGKDVLLLKAFRGHEAVSQLFSYELELLSEVNPKIDFKAIVGKRVTITVKHSGGTRFIDGFVRRFSQGSGDAVFASYSAEIVPWLWMLTQTADCRIFQNKTVPDIIQAIFKDLGFTDFKISLVGSFSPREYCVQYRETDFNFVSRLMEQYGITYFFEHADGRHTLVLVNSPTAHPDAAPSAVRFHAPTGAIVAPDDVVSEFTKVQEIRPAKYALTDYNFETPSVSLDVSVSSVNAAPEASKFEIYDYPGEYLKKAEGDAVVKMRIEEEESQAVIVHGESGCRQFTAGSKFTLREHARADFNGPYVLTSVHHSASEQGYDSGGGDGDHSYSNTFTCIPADARFRPQRATPRPIVQGSQTAEVVGPAGEEIFTDKFGRVKVQFHWDREGTKNENSSCWIRVSHPWAGKLWGSVAIPRIGQEVIVDFLEGDPDQPIVTGRVYNGEQMPPYALPAGGMISGVKSNSTKGGGGYNEISLDDTKGTEKIVIHAQYDMATTIEHDETITVGNNRTESVGKDESISIGGNRTESVAKNETVDIGDNRSTSIGKNETVAVSGNRSESVSKDETIEIEGNRTEQVGKKEQVTVNDTRSHSVGKDDSLEVGKNLQISAGDSVTIKTGSASLTMKKDGTIALKGKDITIEATGKIAVKAAKDVTIKGQKILEN
jgi:type VI secretion system secreted protein VgrG